MPYTSDDIHKLLPLLDEQIAESLENETLDFKECPNEERLREMARDMAICLGNARGGTVVFGIKEKMLGRSNAVVGIDFAPDLGAIMSHLYDTIDPKLPIQFEWMMDGARRLLLMHVLSSLTPPYTTTSGRGSIRIGRDCKPLTGSLLRQLRDGAGLSDRTRDTVTLNDPIYGLSPAALEILRREMQRLGVPDDLLSYGDRELCAKLGIVREGKLTLGGLIVAGREELLAEYVPEHEWKYSRMQSDTEYAVTPVSGRECLLVALEKLRF